MSRFFVAGLINIETTLSIDGFPLPYFPVRYPFFGVHTSVSGVGFNVSKALVTLGNTVNFASLIGNDDNGILARRVLSQDGIADGLVLTMMNETAQSVILYDPDGRRQIHVDLKDIQEQVYPVDKARDAIQACDYAVICNINFARPLLQVAREAGKLIASDVHAVSDLEDPYNRDFMRYADILFLSDESLPLSPEDVARWLMNRYDPQIVVIGLGAHGTLMSLREDDFVGRFDAVQTGSVVNTIGAGDALFTAFLDRYLRTQDPYRALREAMVFASLKIGETGAAEGFVSPEELDQWIEKIDGGG